MVNFKHYDESNPQIWQAFVHFSIKTKRDKGFARYSAKGIFEIIRWHTKVHGNDEFKINNNYTGDYARKMMKEFPEFEGFFVTRSLKQQRA